MHPRLGRVGIRIPGVEEIELARYGARVMLHASNIRDLGRPYIKVENMSGDWPIL
jgi:hypothetical protein